MERDAALAIARASVTRGHGLVERGAYAEAYALFQRALPALVAGLGESDPEVSTLRADLETVLQMHGIRGLVADIPRPSVTRVSPDGSTEHLGRTENDLPTNDRTE